MADNHFDRPKRRAADVRTHYNLNTGGYTIDHWSTKARGKCRGQTVKSGKARWLCDDDQAQEVLLRDAYSGYDRTGHRKYLESFKVCGVDAAGNAIRAGVRNVHAHVYGILSDATVNVNDGTWRRARYSANPPCFVDMETRQCLPNDGSIDVFLASAPNTQSRQTYCTKRKPPAMLPTMFWRPSR